MAQFPAGGVDSHPPLVQARAGVACRWRERLLVNRRILVVDDNPAIHDDYRKILSVAESGSLSDLDPLELELLNLGDSEEHEELYSLGFAISGKQALAQLIQAQDEGVPFAMAFVDMRMPPGWDGLETVERLWQRDPGLQVVICSAYSDYSWDELQSRVRRNDNLIMISKPFDMMEIRQAAAALTMRRHANESTRAELQALQKQLASKSSYSTSDSGRHQAIFEAAPVAMVTADANLGLRSFNAAARQMFEGEAIGNPLSSLTCDESYLPVGANLRMALALSGRSFPAVFHLGRITLDGEPHYVCSVQPLEFKSAVLSALSETPSLMRPGKALSSSLQPCCLNSLARIAGEWVSRSVDLVGGLQLALAPSLPLLEADPEEVQRVLMQLLFQASQSGLDGPLELGTGLSSDTRLAWAGLVAAPTEPARPIEASFRVDLDNWRLMLPLPVLPSV